MERERKECWSKLLVISVAPAQEQSKAKSRTAGPIQIRVKIPQARWCRGAEQKGCRRARTETKIIGVHLKITSQSKENT